MLHVNERIQNMQYARNMHKYLTFVECCDCIFHCLFSINYTSYPITTKINKLFKKYSIRKYRVNSRDEWEMKMRTKNNTFSTALKCFYFFKCCSQPSVS